MYLKSFRQFEGTKNPPKKITWLLCARVLEIILWHPMALSCVCLSVCSSVYIEIKNKSFPWWHFKHLNKTFICLLMCFWNKRLCGNISNRNCHLNTDNSVLDYTHLLNSFITLFTCFTLVLTGSLNTYFIQKAHHKMIFCQSSYKLNPCNTPSIAVL